MRARVEGASLAAVRVIGWLPWRMAIALGGLLGGLARLAPLHKRQVAMKNLRLAGVRDPRAAFRRARSHLGKNLVEMAWSITQSPEEVLRHTTIEGADVVSEAARGGRGVLLVSCHLGNWELVSMAAARSGVPVSVVAKSLAAPRIEQRMAEFRSRAGVRTLVRGRPGASVAAYRCLVEGGILGCMMDRMSHGLRINEPFLGRLRRSAPTT